MEEGSGGLKLPPSRRGLRLSNMRAEVSSATFQREERPETLRHSPHQSLSTTDCKTDSPVQSSPASQNTKQSTTNMETGENIYDEDEATSFFTRTLHRAQTNEFSLCCLVLVPRSDKTQPTKPLINNKAFQTNPMKRSK